MNEKPNGEIPQTEQERDGIKQDLQRERTNLENGRVFPLDLIGELKKAGEARFTADLLKIQFDQTFELMNYLGAEPTRYHVDANLI